MNGTLVFITGILTLVVTIIGAVMAIRKLGPEINKIQVDTSESLVAMARENAEMHRTDAAELRQRNKDLDDRLTAYVEKLGAAMSDIEDLKQVASRVEDLSAENARLRRERNAALTELSSRTASHNAALAELTLRNAEVSELKGRVTSLEDQIRTLQA